MEAGDYEIKVTIINEEFNKVLLGHIKKADEEWQTFAF